MALTAMGIIAGLGAAGSSAYAASQANQGTGITGKQSRVSFPPVTGLQTYLARLFALNAGQTSPSFRDYVQSGGRARFDLLGASQFTPQEAQRLGLVGAQNQPVPWFDPTQQNRLTEQQALFEGQQQLSNRQRGVRKGPYSPQEQLADIQRRADRQEQLLREGTISGQRAQRLTKKLTRNRNYLEDLRAQLFGASGAPGPYDLQGGQAPGDVFGQTNATGSDGGFQLPPAVQRHLDVVSLGQY